MARSGRLGKQLEVVLIRQSEPETSHDRNEGRIRELLEKLQHRCWRIRMPMQELRNGNCAEHGLIAIRNPSR